MSDELDAVGETLRALMTTAQEAHAAVVQGVTAESGGEAEEVVRASALAFVEANKERIAEQLVELGAALLVVGEGTEIAMALVDDQAEAG